MNYLAQKFLKYSDSNVALNMLKASRLQNFDTLGVTIGKFFVSLFPKNRDIHEEYALLLYKTKNYDKSYTVYSNLLKNHSLNQEKAERLLFNQHFCIDHVKDKYIYYNPVRVDLILKRKQKPFPLITLTMTSCKRFDLFEKTMNSFINCCKDIHMIDRWFCVDDNSSEEDKEKMKEKYPFVDFYFKNLNEKGHPQSMNIIRDNVTTPYIFHMEDDWQFFNRQNYMTKCLDVLSQNSKIGQCLINKNYAETSRDHNICGGYFKQTSTGLRYYIHEFTLTEEDKKKFNEKYGQVKQCAYWPHFSFRPSLFRRKVLDDIGPYNEKVSHFEMEYSCRYNNLGLVSAFLEGIYCQHIGRLTSERHDTSKQNAYTLNDEAQFSGKEEKLNKEKVFPFKMKTFIINLDERTDRWKAITNNPELKDFEYTRFSAINGKKLKPTPQLQQIFDNNDYNMRQGMVGCAMSHIKLYVDLLQDPEVDVYCILEDDITFVQDFKKKLISCANMLNTTGWDMFYLGHHLWKHCIDKNVYNKTLSPSIEQFSKDKSFKTSLGGTGGYMINKKGALQLLEIINKTGMTNGIDTVQQKAADDINIFYAYPHLFYSECYYGDNQIDTDIQYNYDSLSMSIQNRLEEELKYYDNDIVYIEDYDKALKLVVDVKENFYYKPKDNLELRNLLEQCKYPYYTLGHEVLFVTPSKKEGRYYHRFKKDDKWDINQALSYV